MARGWLYILSVMCPYLGHDKFLIFIRVNTYMVQLLYNITYINFVYTYLTTKRVHHNSRPKTHEKRDPVCNAVEKTSKIFQLHKIKKLTKDTSQLRNMLGLK